MTPETNIQRLISEAAEAIEMFTEDELEAYAAEHPVVKEQAR